MYKKLQICIIALLLILSNQQETYSNQANWATTSCINGKYQSPIEFKKDVAECINIYDSFEILPTQGLAPFKIDTTKLYEQYTLEHGDQMNIAIETSDPWGKKIKGTFQHLNIKYPAEHKITDNQYSTFLQWNQNTIEFQLTFLLNETSKSGGLNNKYATVSYIFMRYDATNQVGAYKTNNIFSYFLLKTRATVTPTNGAIYIANFQESLQTMKSYQNRYISYSGSKTEPGSNCNEEVIWFVNDYVFTLDTTFFDALKSSKSPNPSRSLQTIQSQLTQVKKVGCYTYYFDTHMRDNFGVWVMWFTIIIYWLYVIISDKDDIQQDWINPKYQNNKWTLWPWYSLYSVGSEQFFTKTSRITILLVQCDLVALVCAGYMQLPTPPAWIPFVAVPFSWFIIYLFGFALTSARNLAKKKFQLKVEMRQFAKDLKKLHELEIEYEDVLDGIYNRYFWFYFMAFALTLVCWPIVVYLMYLQHPQNQQYWVACYILSLAGDWLIFDPILALCNGFGCDFFKKKGFWYDYSIAQVLKQVEEGD